LSPEATTPDYIHRSGAPYGFKPYHLVVGAVVFIAWFSVLGFVLTHGRNEASSVDVYSSLPPGFTGALQSKGITYEGLSPVDATTQQQALAHLPALGNDNGGKPLVFRTSYAVAKAAGQPRTATAALMVVVPDPQGTDVTVDFVDPTSYRELDSIEYGGSGSSAGN
jgi:hypothetical protein